MILFLLSLLAGLLTVLAPCTIALLPVIVGGSLSGGSSMKRALVVTTSLGVAVIAFTLALKVSTSLIAVPQVFWQILSGVIIIVLGITTIIPSLYDSLPFVNKLNRNSNKLMSAGFQKQNFAGDVLVGAALGPVFSSCSPTYFLILATVLPRSFSEGIVYLLAYTVGLCGGLFVVSIAGQKLLELFGIASNPRGIFKRSVGVLFVVVGFAILFGYDKKLELVVANNVFDVTQIEQSLLASQTAQAHGLVPALPGSNANTRQASSDASGGATSTEPHPAPPTLSAEARIAEKVLVYQRAPEITKPSGYINTDGKPITFGEFRGKKVVLVDFWTYSCINCQRTLPYVKAWYDKYHDQGLEIIGIHTPEFSFEKVLANVQNAVSTQFGIKYPVVLDNDYGTWNAFGNQYWPRKYLIDIDGFVVYDHAGEGEYDTTEAAIQKALAERSSVLGAAKPSTGVVDVTPTTVGAVGSPETYFGSNRNEYLANGTQNTTGVQSLVLPDSFATNQLYLSGTWNFNPEYAEVQHAGSKIIYKYNSKDVYFVASSLNGTKITVLVDGKPVGNMAGVDVSVDGTMTVKENRLYKLVHGADYGEHTLELDIEGTGLDAYTFTFG